VVLLVGLSCTGLGIIDIGPTVAEGSSEWISVVIFLVLGVVFPVCQVRAVLVLELVRRRR
jgi:hypothetical protein